MLISFRLKKMRFCSRLFYLPKYLHPICPQQLHRSQFPLQFQRKNHSKINKEENKEKKTKEKILTEHKHQEEKSMPVAFFQKYKVFRDTESPEIFDVEEERLRSQKQQLNDIIDPIDYNNSEISKSETTDSEYERLNMKRGLSGIFDIEDLVDVLRQEMAEDIFVCSVPKEMAYVDYMVICSGHNYRHMFAMAEFVRYLCKHKRNESDHLPKIEGGKSRDWIAMDMGNIALHIFSAKAREIYDLESLWSIGIDYDREFNRPKDPLVKLFERHSFQFSNFITQKKTQQKDQKNDLNLFESNLQNNSNKDTLSKIT